MSFIFLPYAISALAESLAIAIIGGVVLVFESIEE